LNTAKEDRCLGAWFGLAIGDALGAPIQFMDRDTYQLVTGYTSGGRYKLEPGYWTDDTSMALCLAESLIEHGNYVPQDFGDRLVRWVDDGYNSSLPQCFDIGKTTLRAIGNIKRDGYENSGVGGEQACGNGSIMRLAPVPIFYRTNLSKALSISVAQGEITHTHPVTTQACSILCSIILAGIENGTKDAVLNAIPQDTANYDEKLHPIIKDRFRQKKRDEIRSDTYVISTLEAALWSVWSTDNFHDAMLLAVNLGHDADTVGAVTGQIAGAIYGYSEIPTDWVHQLAEQDRIFAIGRELSFR
jgi:ADP-ribosyl-[dinitrogen reductase] hydrolase